MPLDLESLGCFKFAISARLDTNEFFFFPPPDIVIIEPDQGVDPEVAKFYFAQILSGLVRLANLQLFPATHIFRQC